MGSIDGYQLLHRGSTVELLVRDFRPWLDDPAVNEVCVNRPGEVFVERHGAWTRYERSEVTLQWCKDFGIALAAFKDDDFSESKPIIGATLPTGERVQVVGAPATEPDTVAITMRRPDVSIRSMDSYIADGFFDEIRRDDGDIDDRDQMLADLLAAGRYPDFFREAVLAGKNVIVAGATGSGKTSFMKMLVQMIPPHERIITIEDAKELVLPNHPNHVHMFFNSEAVDGDIVTSTSLLKSCMRMRPDRIIQAEIRGGEAYAFVNACMSGHAGSITSLHAGSPAEARERIVSMILANPEGGKLPHEVIRHTLDMVADVIVHIKKFNDRRRITAIDFAPTRRAIANDRRRAAAKSAGMGEVLNG